MEVNPIAVFENLLRVNIAESALCEHSIEYVADSVKGISHGRIEGAASG